MSTCPLLLALCSLPFALCSLFPVLRMTPLVRVVYNRSRMVQYSCREHEHRVPARPGRTG